MTEVQAYHRTIRRAAALTLAAALAGGVPAATVATADDIPSAAPQGHPFEVLYDFTNNGTDGGEPIGGVIADKAGNLYGANIGGCEVGTNTPPRGTVFKLAPDGTLTALYLFKRDSNEHYVNGEWPYGGLVMDKAGNLYGTTAAGFGPDIGGVVFEITSAGTFTILHSFNGGSDGEQPESSLIRDKKGNLYGTTGLGGAGNSGVVFKIAPDGTETVLYSFTGGSDGAFPRGSLIRDKDGNLFGTTSGGGANGLGVIFEITRKAKETKETVLHSFTGNDGSAPQAGLIADDAGNFYGTASGGGAFGYGTVFELAPDGTETLLYSFTGSGDGGIPVSSLFRDKNGTLYGTTSGGGNNYGVVFKLSPDGKETPLYQFQARLDGSSPYAGLTQQGGYLYGTTVYGGNEGCGYGPGNGAVFRIKK